MKPEWPIGLALGLVAIGSGSLAANVAPLTNPAVHTAGLEAHETAAGASLLGQFRTSAAAWIYLRTDLYLHNGVEMRPLSRREREQGGHGVGGEESGRGAHDRIADDDNIVTAIPSAKRDLRGIFGDVERQTSAYKEMENHHHNEPETAMPLFRLMTWVDPSFLPGWNLGAMIMARQKAKNAPDLAIRYLNEGRKANPDSIEIVSQMATLTITRKKDIPGGIRLLEEARRLAQKRERWQSDDEAQAARETYRWLALAYRNTHEEKRKHEATAEGLSRFPDDNILKRLGSDLKL